MPVMWFANDGPRPYSQTDPPTHVSLGEARQIVGLHQVKFVGTDPPSINVERPSRDVRNVVFQIRSLSEAGEGFPHAGFYLVLGLRPDDAVRALESMRA